MSRPLLLLVGLAGSFCLSQSASAQSMCTDPLRRVIWNTLNQDILSGPWDCRKVLERKKLSSGKLNAVVVGGYGAPFCGATGNCSTWVLNRRNGKWRIIRDPGSVIERFEIKPRNSNNYPDLVFRGKVGAGDHYLGWHRFDGMKYEILNCKHECVDVNGRRSISRASRKYCAN